MTDTEKIRIDKWLWAARFYKTRSVAAKQIDLDRVQINQQNVKPAREVKVGDEVLIKLEREYKTVIVRALSAVRGPAGVAQTLYEETEESRRRREQIAQTRKYASEPAHAIAHGRPTKRQRRDLERLRKHWS